jgi:hypothetical protein
MIFRILCLAVAATALAAPASRAENAPPLTVVELFTSQGCSSCPPANANAAILSERPGVLALSFGVTYWDYLGWKDSFARPEFTQRQYDYVRALGRNSPYTPQMVVNGRRDVVGADLDEIEAAIRASERADAARIERAGARIVVGAGAAPSGGADVWLLRFDPKTIDVPVRRGENGGRTLPHKNVVRLLERLGRWTGGETFFAPPAAEPGLKTAILVQAVGGGPILAAAVF